MVEIFRVEAYALGFAGGSGGVDDGDEVFALAGSWRAGNSLLRGSGQENSVKGGARRGFRPGLGYAFADGGVARDEQPGGAVLHHGGEFSAGAWRE